MEILDDIVSEFVVESYESLDQLDRDLLALEETPNDVDRLSSIFRAVHTIKGTSGFLAFPKLEKVTHVGESLLVPLRDGELTLTNDITNNLLAMVDAVRSMLGSIEGGKGEGDDTYQPLIATLEHLRIADQSVPAPETTEPAAGDAIDKSHEQVEMSLTDSKNQPATKKKTSRKRSSRTKKPTTKSKKAATKDSDEATPNTVSAGESAATPAVVAAVE